MTYRGCMSDNENSIGMIKCRGNGRDCIKGRSNANPAYTITFGCIQCEEKITSPTPSMCFNKTETTSCQPLVFGHVSDKCFTIMDGNYLKRGCLNTEKNAEECNKAGKNCHVCSKVGCNGKTYETVKCRKCDSIDDKRCIDDANVYDYGFCMTANRTKQLGCYRWEDGNFYGYFIMFSIATLFDILDSDGMKRVKRGCLHTITDYSMKEECMANSGRCKFCEGYQCNKKSMNIYCLKVKNA